MRKATWIEGGYAGGDPTGRLLVADDDGEVLAFARRYLMPNHGWYVRLLVGSEQHHAADNLAEAKLWAEWQLGLRKPAKAAA